jgi:hypothetical protein
MIQLNVSSVDVNDVSMLLMLIGLIIESSEVLRPSVDKCSQRPDAVFVFLLPIICTQFCSRLQPHMAILKRIYSC